MISLALICASEEKRREMSLLLGEAGFLAYAASSVPEAKEVIRERRPRLIIFLEDEFKNFDELLREAIADFPTIPLIAVLKSRDANRAVSLMLAGAEEVLSFPLSQESVRAVLSRAARLPGTSLSILPPASLRGFYFYALISLSFLGLALSGLAIKKHQATVRARILAQKNSWPLPYFYPSAIAFDGSRFWIADWFSQSLYLHSSATRKVKRVIHFPNEMPVSIAISQDALWTVDASGTIVRRLKDLNLTPVERYLSAPGTTAITYDGLYLWTYDSISKRLHKRLPDSHLTEIASYPYPGIQATALFSDGKNLWSLDGSNREILLHNLERPDEVLSKIPLPEYSTGQYTPTGLGFDGKDFWTVAQSLPPGKAPAELFKDKSPSP